MVSAYDKTTEGKCAQRRFLQKQSSPVKIPEIAIARILYYGGNGSMRKKRAKQNERKSSELGLNGVGVFSVVLAALVMVVSIPAYLVFILTVFFA